MHTLVIMPSGPHRTEGGSCVPGGGSEIFDPTVQNSHLPGLIASSAPAAHAHASAARMRMAVAPKAVAARIFASAPSGGCPIKAGNMVLLSFPAASQTKAVISPLTALGELG